MEACELPSKLLLAAWENLERSDKAWLTLDELQGYLVVNFEYSAIEIRRKDGMTALKEYDAGENNIRIVVQEVLTQLNRKAMNATWFE